MSAASKRQSSEQKYCPVVCVSLCLANNAGMEGVAAADKPQFLRRFLHKYGSYINSFLFVKDRGVSRRHGQSDNERLVEKILWRVKAEARNKSLIAQRLRLAKRRFANKGVAFPPQNNVVLDDTDQGPDDAVQTPSPARKRQTKVRAASKRKLYISASEDEAYDTEDDYTFAVTAVAAPSDHDMDCSASDVSHSDAGICDFMDEENFEYIFEYCTPQTIQDMMGPFDDDYNMSA